MAKLVKLSIRGIRSFGISDEDEQIITFTAPMTLILGANGCGKTTILECIKYALIRELPPFCNKGQSFVHDPKLFDKTESKGQVKLQIKNIKGDLLTVTRSMRTTLKKNTMKFETLDSTIQFENDGRKETISRRCIDTDAEMCTAMGVSKAVINNVLFCHQEDSNWPLEEGKKIKEKFDAIFGTSENDKAIEKIIKFKKMYEAQLKIKDSELNHIQYMKTETENKMLELTNMEKKLKDFQETLDKYNADTVPIRDRLEMIQKIEREVSTLYAQKIELSTKIENCKDHQEKLRNKIKVKFNGNVFELEQEIRSFAEQMVKKKIDLRELDMKLNTIKSQEKNIQKTLNDLESKRGKLIYQRQQEQDYFSERATLISDFAEQLQIHIEIDLENSNGDISSVLANINGKFLQEKNALNKLSDAHDRAEQDLQADIDKIRVQKATVENDIITKKKQIDALKTEQINTKEEINNVEQSAQSLKTITNEIEQLDKVYDNFTKSTNLEDMKKELNDRRNRRDQLQIRFDKIDEQLTFLNSISGLTTEIKLKEKQLETRQQEYGRVRNKHSDNFKRLLPTETITSNYKQKFQQVYQSMQREIKSINNSINQNQQKITKFEMTRKNLKNELNKFEKDLQESEDKLYEHCRSQPYAEVVQKLKETIAKLQLDYGAFKSAESLYKKYINKMEEEPCCPLCHNRMSSNEVGDLTSELQDEIRRLPENIESTERLLKQEQRKYDNLLALQPILEKIDKLKIDIPKLRDTLKQTESELSTALTDAETFQISIAEPNSNLDLVNSMLGDMSLLDESNKDIKRIEDEIKTLKSKLPQRSNEMNLEDVQLERTTVLAELKDENKEIDELQSQFNTQSDLLNKLREKRNSLKDQQLKLQEGVQSLSKFKQRLQEITVNMREQRTELDILDDKLGPLNGQLQNALKEKQIMKDDNRAIFNREQCKIDKMMKIDSEIKRLSDDLQKLKELKLQEQIEQLKVSVAKSMDDQKLKTEQIDKMSNNIEQVKKDISNQEINERDLQDNKELKNLESEEEKLQEKYDELVKGMGNLEFKSVEREKEQLIKKQDELTENRSIIIGQMAELKSNIRKLNSILAQPDYRNSVQNYRKAFYEIAVLKKVITDLGTYRVALEWAILQFHAEKMAKINKTIRELWRSIYRGNDIDYIEIKTDECKDQTSETRRRTFDYCVIQSKNNVELDMRGKCSAGQRVLACLIIRIALAETFSSNCGILALDEPTTNLDRINIVSLCETLNQIVEDRERQSNFMLIIITHDEEFISNLSKIEYYLRVDRDKEGTSKVEKVRVYS